jgi:hypothetical protein
LCYPPRQHTRHKKGRTPDGGPKSVRNFAAAVVLTYKMPVASRFAQNPLITVMGDKGRSAARHRQVPLSSTGWGQIRHCQLLAFDRAHVVDEFDVEPVVQRQAFIKWGQHPCRSLCISFAPRTTGMASLDLRDRRRKVAARSHRPSGTAATPCPLISALVAACF